MCNKQSNPDTSPQAQEKREEARDLDKDIAIADRQLQLANTRANAQYNLSIAGQIQRQFEALQRVAKAWADSTIVPTSYRGNIGNCVIALDIAFRMNINALTVMQNLYIVHGNPSWSSKFLVASINTCGRFTNLRYRKRNLGKVGKVKYNTYEWVQKKGKKEKEKTIVIKEADFSNVDNWECVAYAVEKSTGETLEGDAVSIAMAIQEGWYTKDGSKWVTMPQLMLSYRAAAFWQRIYAPEISMGFRTVEEERDVEDVDYEDVTDSYGIPQQNESSGQDNKPRSANVEDAKDRLRNRDTRQQEAVKQKIEMP